jgi:hypothetical protein
VAWDEPQVSVGGLLEQEILGFKQIIKIEWTKGNTVHQKRRKTNVTKGKGK